ncbi:MAG: hypothetical protein QM324_02680 [Bacteroidota bacterium]|nr:hypothetical protein [Bacteroidota bacterium]
MEISCRKGLCPLVLFFLGNVCAPIPLPGQSVDAVAAMAYLAGGSGAEELSEEEIERFETFLSRPLELNRASRGRLLASGLLTQYQVASLQDYRFRSGDVLSVTELSLVDGFGADFARALAPFVSFRSDNLPGALPRDSLEWHHYLLLRGASRSAGSPEKETAWNYGFKYRLDAGERFEAALAARSVFDGAPWPPSSWSLNMVWQGGRGKVILGDFNTRFGQGLALWSGMVMAGFSSSYSFVRRPSGLSPSWSYSGQGTHRGVAADFGFGRFVLSTFLSFPGLRDRWEQRKDADLSLLPGGNLAWYGRNGQISFTGFGRRSVSGRRLLTGKVSLDARYNFKGIDFFGEGAWDFAGDTGAGVAGISFPAWNEFRAFGVLRLYPSAFTAEYAGGVRSRSKTSDEYGVALGLERGPAVLTADFSGKPSDPERIQGKFLLKWPLQLFPTAVLTFRATERIRPSEWLRYRTDLRMDLDWFSGGLDARYGMQTSEGWTARWRAECLVCRSVGLLSYLEGGCRRDAWSAYLRCTAFRIDHWDDRIYSYERNAPGNYTVPAYYGRGMCCSAVAGWTIGVTRDWKTLRLYFRASTIRYAGGKENKPGRTELLFQMIGDW